MRCIRYIEEPNQYDHLTLEELDKLIAECEERDSKLKSWDDVKWVD